MLNVLQPLEVWPQYLWHWQQQQCKLKSNRNLECRLVGLCSKYSTFKLQVSTVPGRFTPKDKSFCLIEHDIPCSMFCPRYLPVATLILLAVSLTKISKCSLTCSICYELEQEFQKQEICWNQNTTDVFKKKKKACRHWKRKYRTEWHSKIEACTAKERYNW